ncbi:MAG: transcriptional regulator [Halomonas sp.]|uniref:Fic family protein n=1 Tax=Halomonas sp. BC1 TaxID=1670448 RepID=UPI0009BE08F9|nr:RNA-binding domain-containing protein [Halomonas sp. BC1]NGO90852.1 transcriptional regulator [Halomonas sp.]
MTPKLPININDLLHHRTIESERIEYKAGWNPEAILHTLCAFANDFHNLGGGYVLVGVAEENGQPQLPPAGLLPEQIDAIQKELLNLGHSAIAPHYHPLTATYEIQGKTILVLWAPGGETRPYKAKASLSNKSDWAYYLRKHTSTVKASGQNERELLSLAATVPFDDRYRQMATLNDLSPYLLRDFLHEIGSELLAEARELDIETLGRRMNVVGGPSEMAFPKNVGLLFFNEQPEQFFPATQIDVVYFPDGAGGDHFEEKVFKGPLGRITRDALDYINRNYLKEGVTKHADRPQAERFWNYPLAAIEEAVVNAVYHRSYEIREPIEIRLDGQELVVLSFPGPDRSIRLQDLQAGKAVSRRYRNRRIGEFLKELDLTEGRSTGVPKILRVMKANGSPEPIFETDDERSYFLIRLPVHTGFLIEAAAEEPALDIMDPAGPKQGLSKEQVELLQACVEEVPITFLMSIMGRANRTKFRTGLLNPLLDAGLIEMTQPESPRSPTQKYRLSAEGKQIIAHGGKK